MLGSLQRAPQLLCHLALATVRHLWLLSSCKENEAKSS